MQYSNYLGEFLALATIHFLAVVAPGPDFAVTIRQSVRFGRWVGICTALGIGAGISVHVLYTLLGTTYGGDGVNTFHLPDLRGRSTVGTGQGPGLSNRVLGSQAGTESATLTTGNLPTHTHTMPASTQPATHATPAPGLVPATAQNGGAYASGGTAVPLAGGSVGSSQPFAVRSPYLAMQWCIAFLGIYPSQN